MLQPNAPNFGVAFGVNALKYWHLPITKNYSLPKYYIGELVLHRIDHPNGEILHPVTVIGMFYIGDEWIYMIELPTNHPDFKPEDSELDEVEEHQLESIY